MLPAEETAPYYWFKLAVPEPVVMSDHAHPEAAAHSDAPLFSPAEVEQFEADDVQAGGAIGKMLSALFFYTVIAMGIAGWWTMSSINDRTAAPGESAAGGTHEHPGH